MSLLKLPAEEGGADGEACADGGEEDEVALFEAVLLESGVHGERDGAGGGVAVAVDVEDDALHGHAEAVRGGFDDALVGLVRDEAGEVGAKDVVALKDSLGGFGHLADSEFVDGLTVLRDEVLA